MQIVQMDICDGLQVTLEYGDLSGGVLDNTALKECVKEFIEPHVRRKILSGRDCLIGIVLLKLCPKTGRELERQRINLGVSWRAHRPWWVDHPDWGNVPTVGGPQPSKVTPAIW